MKRFLMVLCVLSCFLTLSAQSALKKGADTGMVGKPYVDFTLQNLQGEKASLSDYVGKGKYVLVDFWASWCAPCRAEMPTLKAVYEKYKDKGLEIVGVSLDSNKKEWKKGIAGLALPWPQLCDFKSIESVAAVSYGVTGIPFILLIAPDGTIVAQNLRGMKIEEAVASYLQ